MKTVSFTTLGCKVNQYDTQAMLEQFEMHGYQAAQPGAAADVYVVNTCTVTGTGDKKSMQIIRRCRRRNPQAELIVTGCLAQRLGEKLRETGARLVLGTQFRAQVVELLEKAIAENTQIVAVDNVEGVPYEPLTIQKFPPTKKNKTYCRRFSPRPTPAAHTPRVSIKKKRQPSKNTPVFTTGHTTAATITASQRLYRLKA